MVQPKKLAVFGVGALIFIPGIIASIVSYIILYRVIRASTNEMTNPDIKKQLDYLRKLAIGAVVCLLLGALGGIPYLVLLFMITIPLLRMSDQQASLHPDLPSLKKMSKIYIICISITLGLSVIAGGGLWYLKKAMIHCK